MERTPVLLYHDFYPKTERGKDNFAVSWDNFKEQMEYLHQHGFVAVSLEKFLKPQASETRKRVILTFDDGDISNYHFVFPILKQMGFQATFFITINEIGKKNRVDWSMVYDLAKSGMDIGSHGMSHTFLTGESSYNLLNGLLTSKQILEKYTRKRVDHLSIPRGFYNQNVLTIARDVGFKTASVSDAGYNDFSEDDVFLVRRFAMRRHYCLMDFKSIVAGQPTAAIRLSEGLRSHVRRILGYQVYDRIRSLRHRPVAVENVDGD